MLNADPILLPTRTHFCLIKDIRFKCLYSFSSFVGQNAKQSEGCLFLQNILVLAWPSQPSSSTIQKKKRSQPSSEKWVFEKEEVFPIFYQKKDREFLIINAYLGPWGPQMQELYPVLCFFIQMTCGTCTMSELCGHNVFFFFFLFF